ncbi:SDR family NAD(P)-dependent oxidoreductase [Alicyclobacillus vulcanalis]|uniref:NAD(P)-dependent dehydrogenase, short-chain alcohol dehydrogenase family n=1 Tax=Alicyclobacillus vulcanalis TaxID=252246 RepID=A0A1N7JYL3_9BACL|nr:SDR family NAD(P)-dependent oxidoreductase [Alicyclobacillus vulcanalis]SIS54381.1 NAD(P)-dependent dehydrogenase, short-chain alcohol dehydrogenase family [Alicyclobacillus vulcanalis]
MRDMEGRVAIVTGGAGGIGSATARRFAERGVRVVVADRDEAGAKRVADEIAAAGGEAVGLYVDVTDESSVNALVETAVAQFSRLDIMFNNAGVFGDGARNFLDDAPDEYFRVVSINQHGVFYGMRAAARHMRQAGTGGVIINTASIYAFIADRNQLPYHASKAAVVAMTKAAALDLARYNIRVVAVAPAMVNTGLVDHWREDDRVWDTIQRAHMRRRMAEPDDIARVVVFLASDDARFINGHAICVDDGALSFKR